MAYVNIYDAQGNRLGSIDESKPFGQDLEVTEQWTAKPQVEAEEAESDEAVHGDDYKMLAKKGKKTKTKKGGTKKPTGYPMPKKGK